MKVNINNFKPNIINYNFDINENVFKTNYQKDYQLLIIWSKARTKEAEILDDLNKSFKILVCSKVEWSKEYLNDNFHRLYDVAPTGNIAGKRTEVGDDDFIVVVLEDTNPIYNYRSDASGRLKIVNTNIVDKKNLYRSWVGGSYMIHSTDNINEFFNNSVLLFGKDKTFEIINQDSKLEKMKKLENDLVGANGWSSIEELFDVLNLTTQYVVLRGAENIERNVSELTGDIDILCLNIAEFTAVANAKNLWNSKNFFHVNIAGNNILFDIRYVGDDYFDKSWQQNIISNRVLNENNIYIARIDDYFFSHLYHAYIHKPYFYEKYIARLDNLADKIGIKDFKTEILKDQNYGLKLLNGYLKAQEYDISIPKDLQVFLNIKAVSNLKNKSKLVLYFRLYLMKLSNLPSKIILHLKIIAKKNKTLFNILSYIRNKYRGLRK